MSVRTLIHTHVLSFSVVQSSIKNWVSILEGINLHFKLNTVLSVGPVKIVSEKASTVNNARRVDVNYAMSSISIR